MIKLKVHKLTKEARYPKYATKGSAAMDLRSVCEYSLNKTVTLVRTGLIIAIPTGYVGKLYIRSSLSVKGVSLANGCGIIDSDYRGELKIPLVVRSPTGGFGSFLEYQYKLEKRERVAQLIIEPVEQVEIVTVKNEDDMGTTERGDGGFGSTGK